MTFDGGDGLKISGNTWWVLNSLDNICTVSLEDKRVRER